MLGGWRRTAKRINTPSPSTSLLLLLQLTPWAMHNCNQQCRLTTTSFEIKKNATVRHLGEWIDDSHFK
jgi:hypothetical protein